MTLLSVMILMETKSLFLNTILPELEENCDPPFRLCVHCRDFKVGYHIKWNIQEAIENSNSAIIVMSQAFVDSMWCKEEFADCYLENMRDSAFKLLVIMMQPVETLENTSEYMKSFFNSKTYLDVNDTKLFDKISKHLIQFKLPKDVKENVKQEEQELQDNQDDFVNVEELLNNV